MIGQLNIFGKDKVQVAIERFKAFEPPEGYFLAFSGGKDSVVIKALADMAGVKYDAHYRLTSVDPPELVRFVKSFNDVAIDFPRDKDGKQKTMWNLMPKRRMPPTRLSRWCCVDLKESGGEGRFIVTGVRRAESAKRAGRGGLELGDTKTGKRERVDPDNPDQELIHICRTKAQKILNPIIDWETDEVWEFIHSYGVPYCELYDEGFKRIGCIGCPIGGKQRIEQFKRYPKIKRAYMKAFDRTIEARKSAGLETNWENAQELYDWWING